MAVQLLLEPDFDEGLARHIPRIGCHFDAVQKMLRPAQGIGFRGGAQIGQFDFFRFGPVHMCGGVVRLPINTLLRCDFEPWNDISENARLAIRAVIALLRTSPFACRKVGDSPFTRELITAFGCKGSVALFEIVKDTTVIVRAIWDQ